MLTVVAELCKQLLERLASEPTDRQLSDLAITASKTNGEPPRFFSIDAAPQLPVAMTTGSPLAIPFRAQKPEFTSSAYFIGALDV
jgi:hypothetical protein